MLSRAHFEKMPRLWGGEMAPCFKLSPSGMHELSPFPSRGPHPHAVVEASGKPSGDNRWLLGPARPGSHRAPLLPGRRSGTVARRGRGAGADARGGSRLPLARVEGQEAEGKGGERNGEKRLGRKEESGARRRRAQARERELEPEPSRGRGGARRLAASARGARSGSAEGGARGARATNATAPALRRPRATVPPKLQPGRRAAGRGRRGMGTRQTKGSLAEKGSPGAAPGPRRERPDFWASLLLRAGDKAGRAGAGAGLPPYHRRVSMVQELLRMVRQGRREEAGTLLQLLRQVSGARGRAGRESAPPLPSVAGERRTAPPRVSGRGDGTRSVSRCHGAPAEFEASGLGGGRMAGDLLK